MQQEQINIRVPKELLDRIEEHRLALEKATGLTINRSDTIRALLSAGLEAKRKELGI